MIAPPQYRFVQTREDTLDRRRTLVGYGLIVTSGDIVRFEQGLVTDETYVLVYASFVAQGVLLTVAFVLYCMARWPVVFELRSSPDRGGAFRAAVVSIGAAAAAAGGGVGLLRVVAAIGASPAWHDRWTTLNRVTTGIDGGVFLLVVPGVLMVLRLSLVPRRMRESRLWGVALGVAALLLVTRAIDAANRPKARSDDGLRGARIE